MWEIIKFGIAGCVNTLVHMSVYFLLVEGLAADRVWSSVPAFCVAVVVAYLLSRNWVFARPGKHRQQFVRYVSVALSGLVWNVLLMHTGIKIIGWDYRLVLVLTVGLVAGWSYLVNKFWTFGMTAGKTGGKLADRSEP